MPAIEILHFRILLTYMSENKSSENKERREFVLAVQQLGDRVENATIIQNATVNEKDKIEGMPDLPDIENLDGWRIKSRAAISATSSVPGKCRIWLKECDTKPEEELQDTGAFPNIDQKMYVLLMAKMEAKGGIWTNVWREINLESVRMFEKDGSSMRGRRVYQRIM